jgi:hypothetical protein
VQWPAKSWLFPQWLIGSAYQIQEKDYSCSADYDWQRYDAGGQAQLQVKQTVNGGPPGA